MEYNFPLFNNGTVTGMVLLFKLVSANIKIKVY
jgi:hypothetical protein